MTALGSSREDQRLLEKSVRGILRRKNEWRGSAAAQRAIEKAESDLRHLEGELATVERDLRAFREAETHPHELPGGYSGTAAQIARALREQEEEFGWFLELPADAAFPLDPSESAFLAEAHARFTAQVLAELEPEIGTADLPNPNEFQELIARLMAAEESAQRVSHGADLAKLEFLEPAPTERLRELREAVEALTDLALRAGRVLGNVSETILEDLVASAEARWIRQAADSEALARDAARLLKAIGAARVELPEDIEENRLRTDVERRLAHFEKGGWKGFFALAPPVVRETRYIVERCRVGGQKAAPERLSCLRDHLELQPKVRELRELWGSSLAEAASPGQGHLTGRRADVRTEGSAGVLPKRARGLGRVRPRTEANDPCLHQRAGWLAEGYRYAAGFAASSRLEARSRQTA